jgi:hypothetical protein
VFLSACIDDTEQLGVGVLDGRPVAVLIPCRSQAVASLEILLTEDDNSPAGGDGQVLWRAGARKPGSTAFATPIGQAPDGFDSTISLAEPLTEGTRYTLYMHWSGGGADVIILSSRCARPWSYRGRSGIHVA